MTILIPWTDVVDRATAHLSSIDPVMAGAIARVGPCTAEMILMFSLGRPDVLPVDDLGFQEGVREAYGLESRPTRKELLERGEAWRPYRSIATWYMWGIRRLSLRIERERTRIVSL